jgi:hypothetical protein
MRHPVNSYKQQYEERAKIITCSKDEQAAKEEALDKIKNEIDAWGTLYNERESRYDKFKSFIDANYIKTKEVYNSDLLEVQDPGFDCYMCVTDVIWSLIPTHSFDRGYLLGSKAMEGKQKIAYAASRGVPKSYTQEEKSQFFHFINDIDEISVRERSLKDFMEDNTNKNITLVQDPVLLHDKKFWEKVAVRPKEERYVLLYYVMEKAVQTIKRAVEYAKKYDIQIIEISDRPEKNGRVNDENVKHIFKYDVSMEEWLGYIANAECIFTNSFHACCFSAIFERMFYVGFRMGDKVKWFLAEFGLEDRLMPRPEEIEKRKAEATFTQRVIRKIKRTFDLGNHRTILSMPSRINYRAVRKKFKEHRKESEEFLLTAIQNAENRIAAGETKNFAYYDEYRKQLEYPVYYHSGIPCTSNSYDLNQQRNKVKNLASGCFEYYRENEKYKNDGSSRLEKNQFQHGEYKFVGWHIRLKIDTKWFLYMGDGSLNLLNSSQLGALSQVDGNKKLFEDESTIPSIPVNRIRLVVAEAVWE